MARKTSIKKLPGNRRYVPDTPVPDVRFWSIERALQHGYVIDGHAHTISCTRHPKDYCAVRYASYGKDYEAKACEKQCADCARVCHMNDYIRGKLPPHYPVPAIQMRIEYDHSHIRAGRILALMLIERGRNNRAVLVEYWPKPVS